ncbi:MAG: DUF4870 domain-containing protein [Bacteroidota bacterium]
MNELTSDERTWGTAAHLGGFAGGILPFGHIIAPLIIWQLKKSESSFVDQNGKSALNFQLSITLYILVICLMIIPFLFFSTTIAGIELPLLLFTVGIGGVVIVQFILIIMAAIKAAKGEVFHYPFVIKFVK